MKTSLYFKKSSFVFTIIIVLMSLFSSEIIYSQSSNCNAKLEVINNQFNKKAGESGVSYRLKLTNIGFDSSNYKIELINANSSTKGQLSFKNNRININGDFYNVSLKRMKSLHNSSTDKNIKDNDDENEIGIFLKGKESKIFIIKMKTPVGAKIGSINTSEVKVTSDKCRNNIISVVLNTEIIDGE